MCKSDNLELGVQELVFNHSLNFLFTAETHKEKLAIACDAFPRKRKPGKTFVYHTSDTYLLGSAMNNFLTENTNDSDYFIDLLTPFLKLYGLSSISQHSLRTNDETLTPYTGFGMYFNSNDLFQLSQMLHSFEMEYIFSVMHQVHLV